MQAELAGFDPTEVENIREQTGQAFRGAGSHLDKVALFVVEVRGVKELEHAEYTGQGRADFVAHIGQEFAFCLVGGIGLGLGCLERAFDAQLLGHVPVGTTSAQGAAIGRDNGFADMADGYDGAVRAQNAHVQFAMGRGGLAEGRKMLFPGRAVFWQDDGVQGYPAA